MAVKFKKGFTMVELLVAMAIIGLLIATAIWGIGVAQQSARNTQRREAGSQILAGFSEYYSRFNKQPSFAGFSTTGLCLADSALTAAQVNACSSGNVYKVQLNGIALSSDTTATAVSITAGPTFGAATNASATQWVLGSSAGTKICASLEGGGYGNLSEPQSITCP